ncbi:MAG: creatininase family protein [Armatimonadetes bacterium]|nr:creatininase family protein [Armatimonadota bacterium]
MHEVFWHKMTGPEVAEMANITDVALVPLGCTEMHGPHLPTGCDGWCSAEICERAARIEPAIVLPPLFYNVNDRMMDYPGTIAITHETMRRLHHDICAECARNGFPKVLYFVGHGGSQDVLEIVQAEVLEWRARGMKVDYFPVWVFVSELMREELQQVIHTRGGHGCEMETSLALAACPELVKLDRVAAGQAGPHRPHKIERASYRVPWVRNVPLGYIGEPWHASAQKGEKLIDVAATRLAEAIRQFKQFDPSADP